ncbi:MAG: hypothetical protein ABSB91_08060 [Sedimentisphaerales bacterium]|jgi:hypothetical protein
MLILKKIVGSILFLAGAYLVGFEVAMSLGESHSIRSKDLIVIVGIICIGVGMIYGGIRLVGGRKIVAILLYVFALFLLYIIFSDPKPEGELACFIFPLLLIIGGTLLLKKRRQKNK